MGEEFDRDDVKENLHCLNEVCSLSPENVKLTDKQLENAEGFIISVTARIEIIRTVRAAKKKLEEEEQRAKQERYEKEQKEKAQNAQEMARSRPERAIPHDQNTSSSTSLLDDNSHLHEALSENEENGEKLMPTNNSPRVDFISFIDSEGAYLMLKKQPFPMEEEVRNEQLGYPLGVAYDEESKNWIICDRDLNKIILMNLETQSMNICENLEIQCPTAVVVYTEGHSVAVLCSESSKNRNQHNIYIYNYRNKDDLFLEPFALHSERIYDMRFQLRGLAKSVAGNIISLENGFHSVKKLRVFKRAVGGKGFEIKGASSPSFLATYRSTVAVSDLGVNKVFIINLDDTAWDQVAFSIIRVLDSTPDLSLDILANQTGFKFVAGMQFDINGHLLIGDAKGHTIKLYDTDYDFLHRISSDFHLPYMSSFHINSKGECVILDVHAEKKLHWVKMESISKILPWLPGRNLPPRGGSVRRPQLPQRPRRGGFQNNNF